MFGAARAFGCLPLQVARYDAHARLLSSLVRSHDSVPVHIASRPNSKKDTTRTRKNPDSRKRGVYIPHRTGAGGEPGAVNPPGYYAPRDRTLGPLQAPRHSSHLSTPDHGDASRSSFLRTG